MDVSSPPRAPQLRRQTNSINETQNPDPFIWEVFGLVQCDSVFIEWRGNEPPFTVTILAASAQRNFPFSEAELLPWDTVEHNTQSTQSMWTVDVPSDGYVSIQIVDRLGRNYTTSPKIVGRSRDYSCLPRALQPAVTPYSPQPTSVDINYNYRFDNSRLWSSVIIAAVIGALSFIIVLIIICVCVRKSKKREKARKEREANPQPRYGQFIPFPGAAPIVYVQLVPGAPWVPAGAQQSTEALLPADFDRDAPLSRSPSLHVNESQTPDPSQAPCAESSSVSASSGNNVGSPGPSSCQQLAGCSSAVTMRGV